MAQQTLLGGDGTTGETGATHNSKANSNFTELYTATAAAQADADAAQTAISDHISDATEAHASDAIAYDNTTSGLGAENVKDAIDELASVSGVGDATASVKGIAKLFPSTSLGTNTDGAPTQNAAKIYADTLFGAVVKAREVPIDSQQVPATTGTKFAYTLAQAITITAVAASLRIAQTGGSIFTIDINKNGTSILSTKLTIDNGEVSSGTAAAPPVISGAVFAAGDVISFDIDQIGDGTAIGPVVTFSGT